MNLDEQQKQIVAAWIREGLSLSQIQTRIASELELRLTYMELRFLLDDLKLKPKDQEPAVSIAQNLPLQVPAATGTPPEPGASGRKGSPVPAPQPTPGAGGQVSLTVDQVTRAGALVSGSVTFTDGNSAEWYLDQLGRLGVVPKQAGYKPSQPDLMAFQRELQNELAKLGF